MRIRSNYEVDKLEIQASANTDDAVTKLKKLTTSLKEIKSVQKATSAINGFFSIATFKMATNAIKNVYNSMKKTIELSSGYIENLHLFEVSMRKVEDEYGNLDKEASKYYLKGLKFQNTLHEKFGTNMNDTLKYQGLFNQMAKSMKIPEDAAYTLSEGFTKLGYDLSSLYNLDPTAAMQKLRAGLAGQTKPLRDIGLDITQQSLTPKLKELGIDRSVTKLSQAEKMLLRYIVLIEQASSSHKDFAKTIETPANQLKVLSEQLKELVIAIGNLFITKLAEILPYINGFVMALKEVIQFVAVLLGYTTELSKGIGSYNDESIDLGFEDELEKAKKLKNFTLGFDELNVLKQNEDSSNGVDFGTIDPKILEAVKNYDNAMETITMKATTIRDTIMEWLGFTKQINEETGEYSWYLNDGYTNLEKIRDILLVIAGIKLTTGIINLINTIKNSGLYILISGIVVWFWNLGKAIVGAIGGSSAAKSALVFLTDKLKKIFSWVLIVVGVFLYFKSIFEIIKDGNMSLQDMFKIIGYIGMAIIGVALVFKAIPALIVGIVAAVGVLATAIYTYWDEIITNIKVGLNWLGSKIMGFFAGVGKNAIEVGTNIKYEFKKAIAIIVDFFKTGFENALIEVQEPFINFINEIIGAINSVISFFGGKEFEKLKISETLEAEYKQKQRDRDLEIVGLEEERQAKIDELNASLDRIINSFDRQQQENEWQIYDEYLSKKTPEELEKLEEANKETKELVDKLLLKIPWSNDENKEDKEKETENIETGKALTTATEENTSTLKEIKDSLAGLSGINLEDTDTEITNELLATGNDTNKDMLNLTSDISSNFETANKLSEEEKTSMQSIYQLLKNDISNKLSGIKKACENIKLSTNVSVSSGGSSGSSSGSKSSSSKTSTGSSLLGKLVTTIKNITGFAEGGMPQSASLFYAHENGIPELVGKLGNNSAVMNNEQIVQAVSTGVASAVAEVMQNQKNKTVIQIDGKEILSATERAKSTRGYGVVGGVFAKG